MLSEQDFFFFFHTCHIPGAWSISKCCPNSIRISSWLRRNFHCGERRSHRVLYPYIYPYISAVDYFLPCDGFFILNQSRVASFKHKHGELTSAPKYTVGNDLLKAKPKRQPSLGSMPITTVGKVWKFSVSRDLQGLNCQILLIGICGISLIYYRMSLARGFDLSWQHAGWLRGPQLSHWHNVLSNSKSILHSISEDRS